MNVYCSDSQYALDSAVNHRISRALETLDHTYIIVPAQMGFNTERRIIYHTDSDGFYSIEVVSFEKLARMLLERVAGRALPAIDSTGMTMLAKEALLSLEGDLDILDPHADDTLHLRLAALVKALRSEGITSEQLKSAECTDGVLKGKLSDLAKLLYRIENSSAGMDEAALEQFAYSGISQAEFLKGSHIIVHGFDSLSHVRIDALKALDTIADSLSVYLLADSENDIFSSGNRLSQILGGTQRKIPDERKDDTALLARELFRYPYRKFRTPTDSITVYKCTDPRAEAKAAAALAIKYIQEGTKPNDIAICVSDMNIYSNILDEVFSSSQLPFFIENKRPLIHSDIAVLILSALRIINEGWRLKDLLLHLKTGLLPVEPEEADELIRFVKEHGIKGRTLRRTLKDESMENIRGRAFSPLDELCNSEGSVTERLIAYLDALNTEEKLEALADKLAEAGLAEEAAFTRQTFERTVSILEQAGTYLPNADVHSLYSAISAGFESSSIAVTPPLEGQITVGELTHSVFPRVSRMIAVGICDSLVPHTVDDGGIITNSEAESLADALTFFPSALSPSEQKALIMRAFSAGASLDLTYNTSAGPSYIIDRVKRISGAVELAPPPLLSRSETFSCAAAELRSLADGADLPPADLALFMKSEPEAVSRLAAYMQPRPVRISPDTSKKLYGKLRGSTSLIEDFYRCSYKHFMDYGIKPVELKELREDAMSAGSYIHSLLENVTHTLERRRLSWQNADDNTVSEIIDSAADKMRSEHNKGIFNSKRFAFTEKRLKEEVLLATRAVRASLTGMHIAGSEVGFRHELGSITLTGRIDRIDLSDDGFLRVVDYKSGNSSFDLCRLYYGLSIQLMIYLIAAMEIVPGCTPAGGFYMNVSLPFIPSDKTESDRMKELRMNGFALADADAAASMEKTAGKLTTIKLTLNPDGIPYGSSAFSRAELDSLMRHCEKLAQNAVSSILSGKLEVNPAEYGGTIPCDYCEYFAVCRREDSGRSLPKLSQTEILNNIKNNTERN